jgi:predicted protein tyrosine phosphatase
MLTSRWCLVVHGLGETIIISVEIEIEIEIQAQTPISFWFHDQFSLVFRKHQTPIRMFPVCDLLQGRGMINSDELQACLQEWELQLPPGIKRTRTLAVELGVLTADACRAKFTLPETFFRRQSYLSRKLTETAGPDSLNLIVFPEPVLDAENEVDWKARSMVKERSDWMSQYELIYFNSTLNEFLSEHPEWKMTVHVASEAETKLHVRGDAGDPSEILPGLWQGGMYEFPRFLEIANPGKQNIAVVSIGHGLGVNQDEVKVVAEKHNIRVKSLHRQLELDIDDLLYIAAVDGHAYPMAAHFEPAIAFITRALSDNRLVFVHCAAGVNRSSTIMLAFLMAVKNLTLAEAWQYLHRLRSEASPLCSRFLELQDFEFKLRGRRATIGLPRAEWS